MISESLYEELADTVWQVRWHLPTRTLTHNEYYIQSYDFQDELSVLENLILPAQQIQKHVTWGNLILVSLHMYVVSSADRMSVMYCCVIVVVYKKKTPR